MTHPTLLRLTLLLCLLTTTTVFSLTFNRPRLKASSLPSHPTGHEKVEEYSLYSKPSYSFFRLVSPRASLLHLTQELSLISQVQRDSSLEYIFSRMQNQVSLTRQSLLLFLQRRLLAHNLCEQRLRDKAQLDMRSAQSALSAQDHHQRLLMMLQSQEMKAERVTSSLSHRERRRRRRRLFILSTWLEDMLPDPAQGKSWMGNMLLDALKISVRSAQLLLSLTKIVPKPKVLEGLE